MNPRPHTPVALGLRALRGGPVAVAVALADQEPRVVLSTRLATAADGDRLAFEPYHVAFELQRGRPGEVCAEAAAAVAEGRRRQARLAAEGLQGIVLRLAEAARAPVVAALLVNRAGWMTDLLEHSLSAPEHPPVAEGLAVRDALRSACRGRGIPIVEMDEKSLRDAAAEGLRRPAAEIDATLRELGRAAGRPWRAEQKLACLAGWVAAAEL